MSISVWEQYEWLGIARRGAERRDPRSSWQEINTRPGQDELKRIEARQALYSTGLPSLAAYWPDGAGHYVLVDKDGVAPDASYKTTNSWHACVAFRCGDPVEVVAGQDPVLFAAGSQASFDTSDPQAWSIYIVKIGAAWQVRASMWNGSTAAVALFSPTYTEGDWIWADLSVSATAFVIGVAESTETSVSYGSAATFNPAAITATNVLTVGSLATGANPCREFAIAYAALGTTAVTPWSVLFAESGRTDPEYAFYPTDATRPTLPAKINDAADKYQWIRTPAFGLNEVSTTAYFAAKGVRIPPGGRLNVDLGGGVRLDTKTVFLVKAQWTGPVSLLRSNDSGLYLGAPWTTTDFGQMELTVQSLNPANGYSGFGGLAGAWSSASAFALGTVHWLALELNPDVSQTAVNVALYRWVDASAAWATVGLTNAYNPTALACAWDGFSDMDLSRIVIGDAIQGTCDIYDFRIAIGDEGWQTTHTATAISSTMAPNLVCWLNADQSGRFPRDSLIAWKRMADDAGYYRRLTAVADRVDGAYRYTAEQLHPVPGWHGCPHVDGARPPIRDLVPAGDENTVYGETPGYGLQGQTVVPSPQSMTKAVKRLAKVGRVDYLLGAPLVRRRGRLASVGSARFRVLGGVTAVGTSDWKGALSWATNYKYRVTVYDPETGTEGNYYGSFHFTTGTAPTSTTAPAVATPGCAYSASIRVYTMANLHGQYIKAYRFHEPTGTYYFEGSSPLSVYTGGGSYPINYYEATFRFSLSDDELSMQPVLQYDNNPPPLHSTSYIWSGRAWFVDAVNPSRVWCSKIDQPGSVPGSNVITTDEGVGGDILGFLSGFGGLLLLRERSIWIIPQFLEIENAYAQPLISGIGCVSGAAAVFAENILWWAAPTGITSFDGQTITDHSDRIKGVDRDVWKADPRRTFAYYDRIHYRLVFVSGGSGVTLDIRSGAVSLVSAPETSYAEAGLADYAGALYGGHGMVFRESPGNRSLSLTSGMEMSSPVQPPFTAASMVPIVYHWHDGSTANVGTATLGYECDDFVAGGFLTATSNNGQVLHSMAKDRSGIHAGQIFGIGSTSSASAIALVGLSRAATGDCFLDLVPFYYGGQDLFLGSQVDTRVYDCIDLVTGDAQTGTASGTVDFAAYSKVAGRSAELAVSCQMTFAPDTDLVASLHKRGQQLRIVLLSSTNCDLPEVRALRVHFTQLPPRSRNR